VDPHIPYTSHNSSATLHLLEDGNVDLTALADDVQAIMLEDFQEGSDPGLCVAHTVTQEVKDFGQRAKREVVRQSEARDVAARSGCVLRGLGGTEDGVIGALAGIGLAAGGDDGRFILIGRSREMEGVQSVQAILECGIAEVRTTDGEVLQEGLVETGGKLRPAFRGNRAVLVVRHPEGEPTVWVPAKLD
jgi:tRNA(Ile2) C34 agmatinyltransferase TiaS